MPRQCQGRQTRQGELVLRPRDAASAAKKKPRNGQIQMFNEPPKSWAARGAAFGTYHEADYKSYNYQDIEAIIIYNYEIICN
jgi:hypothetical protein